MPSGTICWTPQHLALTVGSVSCLIASTVCMFCFVRNNKAYISTKYRYSLNVIGFKILIIGLASIYSSQAQVVGVALLLLNLWFLVRVGLEQPSTELNGEAVYRNCFYAGMYSVGALSGLFALLSRDNDSSQLILIYCIAAPVVFVIGYICNRTSASAKVQARMSVFFLDCSSKIKPSNHPSSEFRVDELVGVINLELYVSPTATSIFLTKYSWSTWPEIHIAFEIRKDSELTMFFTTMQYTQERKCLVIAALASWELMTSSERVFACRDLFKEQMNQRRSSNRRRSSLANRRRSSLAAQDSEMSSPIVKRLQAENIAGLVLIVNPLRNHVLDGSLFKAQESFEDRDGPLPQAWISSDPWQTAKDDHGRLYYYNPTTSESCWTHPAAPADALAYQPQPLVLPEPWLECLDDVTGRKYYRNPQSGDSQWTRPVTRTRPILKLSNQPAGRMAKPGSFHGATRTRRRVHFTTQCSNVDV
jgi:hypothetical protein